MSELRKLIEAVEAGKHPEDLAACMPDQRTTDMIYSTFRGSLDAAKALHDALLPGWFPGLSQNIHSGMWFSWVQSGDRVFDSFQGNPARAWLIAILKAYEAQQ